MTLDLFYEGAVDRLTSKQRAHLVDRALTENAEAATAAAKIIARVRASGDDALRDLGVELDGVELAEFEVPRSDWESAAGDLSHDLRAAFDRAARNIGRFHAALIPEPVRFQTEPGVVLERRVAPVRRAGVYAAGGKASHPSTVLMGAIPARSVGVNEVVVCSPPGPDGRVAGAVQAACWFSGADRLFAIGGAGAVAAMAYGTESVPRVDVLVGPGDAYVNEAKRLVGGTVRIDGLAGPSELLVLADSSARPDWVAAEVIAQAERDVEACVGVVCIGVDVAADIRRALAMALAHAPQAAVARPALLRHGFILVAEDRRQALRFVNAYGPERLSIMLDLAADAVEHIRSCGTIFVGSESAVAFGDYLSGANHLLPTAGAARAFSGLSSDHFLRSYTVQTITDEGARSLAGPTAVFAEAEGLPGHAEAARLRGGVGTDPS